MLVCQPYGDVFRRLASPHGLEAYVENLQKGFLEEALRRTDGVQVKAAELLRMSYRSFRHYMQKYNIPS